MGDLPGGQYCQGGGRILVRTSQGAGLIHYDSMLVIFLTVYA